MKKTKYSHMCIGQDELTCNNQGVLVVDKEEEKKNCTRLTVFTIDLSSSTHHHVVSFLRSMNSSFMHVETVYSFVSFFHHLVAILHNFLFLLFLQLVYKQKAKKNNIEYFWSNFRTIENFGSRRNGN